MVFVRNALIGFQDEQLIARASSDLAAGLLEVNVDDSGLVRLQLTDAAEAGEYYVAVYAPGTKGELKATVPPTGGPIWPETFLLADTYLKQGQVFTLEGEDGAAYRASAGVLDLGIGEYYTQVIALPLAPIDRTVATFFGIFAILAFITIGGGAFLTRLLVTQAFRQLGQVESAATAIAAGDFRQRLSPGDPRTEVGKLTSALNAMLDKVDASLSERDTTVRQMRRFIGDASHELRTPLVTVRGYAELYRMGAIRGDEDTAQAMERIEKEALRMGVMVEDLLALARLDERRDVVAEPVDLRPVARDAAMDVRAASPQRTVTVIDLTAAPPVPPAPSARAEDAAGSDDDAGSGKSVTGRGGAARRAASGGAAAAPRGPLSLLRRIPRPVPASRASDEAPAVAAIDLRPLVQGPAISRPPVVLGDENRVRQIVANLLGNARRFTPDDSPIDITVGVDADRVTEHAPLGMGWIAIADHGEGIPEQIRANIFERFWRADNSRARETGGTGLGLAIVASIVDALHGEVAVNDTPGGGATFTVFLPLAKESTLYLDTQPLPKLPDT